MTIHVQIKNMDNRVNARVEVLPVDMFGNTIPGSRAIELLGGPADDPDTVGNQYVHSGQNLLVTEMDLPPAALPDSDGLLRFFQYTHLPEHLQRVSLPFNQLAMNICHLLPGSAERTVALRKLLEAKDAAVRAAVDKGV